MKKTKIINLVKTKLKKWFTLVELIIVITILAILATIAFISFQWYTKNARDSNRIETISNLQTWLDIYAIQVWNLPEPDWTISSWSLNWVQLTRVWVIWDNISRLVKINKTPTDPFWSNNYAYWISADNKYYQIWITLETPESYNAKVVWNYKYPLKYNWKLYSLPSLLFTWIWWDLSQTWNAYFVVDKWVNIPYTPNKSILNNTQTTTQVLQSITWTWNLVLTWINIPTETSEQFKALTSTSSTLQNLEKALWIDQTQLWNVIYGSNYNTNTSVNATNWGSTPSNSCATTPSWVWIATTVAWTPTSVNQAWQSTNAWNPCYYTCNTNYSWNNCSTYTAPITFLQNCTNVSSNTSLSGWIIYTNSSWVEIARVDNQWNTISWTPSNLDCSWNIIVCSWKQTWYILSACNVWAKTTYNGQIFESETTARNSTVNAWAWWLYQWWRDEDVSTWNYITSTYAWSLTNSKVWNNNFYKWDASYWDWWQTEVWSSSPTRWTWTNVQSLCGTGYHIPTWWASWEWQAIYNAWWWSSVSSNKWTALSNSLKLPFAGRRNWNDGTMTSQGSSAYYWSTTSGTTSAYFLAFDTSNIIGPANYSRRGLGFSLRCIKN